MNAFEPLQLYEVGKFGELARRPNPNDLVVLPVPPVEEMLLIIARRLGRSLTPDEIEAEYQQAPSIVLLKTEAEKMTAERARKR